MKPRARNKADGEKGAALATVLVMLSIMSTLAIVAVDAAQFSLRRTQNQTAMEQARWYLMGAETLAAGRIADLLARNESLRIDESDWQGRDFTFPLDGGGVMSVTLWDGGNCFNLNSLVEQTDDGPGAMSALGFVQFARLLDVLGVRSTVGAGLAAPLVDWIDADRAVSVGGAEDESYRGAGAPYQPPNTLIADVSELDHVRGFSPEIIAEILPYVCVRPTAAPNTINPNTLRPEQAPLLVMALGQQMSVSAARDIIARRPQGGWQDVDSFFLESGFTGVEIPEPTRALFSTHTRYFVMSARVQLGDISETSAALIETNGGVSRVLRRVYGAGAAGRTL